MKQSHWLLWQGIVIGPEKIRPLLKLTQLAPRGMKTYSETRLELRNLRMLRKMLEKSSQFLSSEQPCEPKSLDVALNVAGVERISLRVRSTLEAI